MYHTTRRANQWRAIPNMQTEGSTSETIQGSGGGGSRDTNESQDARIIWQDKSHTNRQYHGNDQETVLTACPGRDTLAPQYAHHARGFPNCLTSRQAHLPAAGASG